MVYYIRLIVYEVNVSRYGSRGNSFITNHSLINRNFTTMLIFIIVSVTGT